MVILSLKVVLRAGLEPTTLCLEGRCNQVQKRQKMAIFHDFFTIFSLKPSFSMIYYHGTSLQCKNSEQGEK